MRRCCGAHSRRTPSDLARRPRRPPADSTRSWCSIREWRDQGSEGTGTPPPASGLGGGVAPGRRLEVVESSSMPGPSGTPGTDEVGSTSPSSHPVARSASGVAKVMTVTARSRDERRRVLENVLFVMIVCRSLSAHDPNAHDRVPFPVRARSTRADTRLTCGARPPVRRPRRLRQGQSG